MVDSFPFDNHNADNPEEVEGRNDAEQIAGSATNSLIANRW
jgi:hypothetical protein